MKYYLTTPLYYVNSRPHIGHSYTNIAADALARFNRLIGNEVKFLTGTDEHGQKIDKAAQAAGMAPQEFTDKISQTFSDLWKLLNISNDDFIRTTEERHKKTVRYVWEKLKDKKINGENILYSHTYDGWYCVSCETFITEGLLDPNNPGLCPDCKKPVEQMKEDTYFFRMSAYQERLTQDIRQGKFKILPETRRNEVLGFLEHNKLTDLSVSRPKNRLAWGIPIPFDPDHVTYVWFDALINYVSAVGYGSDDAQMKKWWPADVHIIGKDIIRHHAVIWPILLYALELELPKMIFAHGWWVTGGEKMSKSKGNAVDPIEIVKTYGVDPYRYFLLSEAPFGSDGTFSEEALTSRFNTDLANDLGNLLHRTLTMCEKYFDGNIPRDNPFLDRFSAFSGQEYPEKEKLIQLGDNEIVARSYALRIAMNDRSRRLPGYFEKLDFSNAISDIWQLISEANKYIELTAPWKLAKQENKDELALVILSLLEVLRFIAEVVGPFIPETGEAIRRQLGIKKPITESPFCDDVWGYFKAGGKIEKGTPLFPRIEAKKE